MKFLQRKLCYMQIEFVTLQQINILKVEDFLIFVGWGCKSTYRNIVSNLI